MSARDFPEREKVKAHVAGLFEILGKPYDEFRPVWSGADNGTRRAFLTIAKMPAIWACREWDGLARAEREQLKTRVMDLAGWLNSKLEGVARA